jgi:hypothetical protein
MNWLKTLWNNLVNKTSVRPTLVLVEEETAAEILTNMLVKTGVSQEYITEHVLPRFEEVYDGAATEEAVKAGLNDFTAANPGIGRGISKQQSAARSE